MMIVRWPYDWRRNHSKQDAGGEEVWKDASNRSHP